MKVEPSSSLRPCSRAARALALVALSAVAAAQNPNYVLRASQTTAAPGQTVTVHLRFDNTGANVEGWSYGLAIPAALTFSNWRHGATTQALNGGTGPDFGALNDYPGQGVATGTVCSFFFNDFVYPGLDQELQAVDVTVPIGAVPGTVYPLTIVETLGSPPIAVVVVVGGQSIDPTLVNGSILVETGAAYCFGDGSAGVACPCGAGNAGRGCPNSVFANGSQLASTGIPSVSSDTVALQGTSLTGTSAVFFQGTATTAVVVDDGIGCVTGSIIRLGTKPVASNASSFPQAGDPLISVRGLVPPGATRHYQCFYRNAAPLFCPPATSNRTNGLTITWGA
jgi:hypothetical protein